MALPATAVWEVRTTATAGNVNGGGFNSARGGTDYTLQDASQTSGSDGTSTASTTFTSATATFTSQMVGNYLHLVSGTGTTPGWYEITAYTSANQVTLDRNSGTYTLGVFHVGGAALVGTTLDDDMFEAAVAGNMYWIKLSGGTYTLGESISLTTVGTATAEITVSGYNATRGDNPTGANRPTFACGANTLAGNAFWNFNNLIITGTAATLFTPGAGRGTNIKAVNSSTTTTRVAQLLSSNSFYANCEAISYRGYAYSGTGSGDSAIRYSYAHDSAVGIRTANTPSYNILGNIIADNYTTAIDCTVANTAQSAIIGNTIYGASNKLGTGIAFVAGFTRPVLLNNIIAGFVSGVTHADSTNAGYDNWNCYNNNTTDVTNWTKGPDDITTDPAFTNVALITFTNGTTSGSVLTSSGADFSTVTDNVDFLYLASGTGITVGKYLITAHTGTTLTLDIAPGTNATADKVGQITTGHNFLPTGSIGGFPGAMQAGLTTGYASIGAIQKQAGGGSSGTSTTFGG